MSIEEKFAKPATEGILIRFSDPKGQKFERAFDPLQTKIEDLYDFAFFNLIKLGNKSTQKFILQKGYPTTPLTDLNQTLKMAQIEEQTVINIMFQ